MQNSSAFVTDPALRTLSAIQTPALRYTTLQSKSVLRATLYSIFDRGKWDFKVNEVADEEGSRVSLSRLSVSVCGRRVCLDARRNRRANMVRLTKLYSASVEKETNAKKELRRWKRQQCIR